MTSSSEDSRCARNFVPGSQVESGSPQKTEKSYAKGEWSQIAIGLQLADGIKSKAVP